MNNANNAVYAVTFDRNYNDASIKQHGGLFVNIGQTKRGIEKRLNDADYKRKQGGGSPIILGEWYTQVKDHQIHKMLKRHPKVRQTQKEEFKFMVDNVETAELQIKQIVSDIIDSQQSAQESGEKDKRIKKIINIHSPDDLITAQAAAKKVSKSVSTIRIWAADGKITSYKKNYKNKNLPLYVSLKEVEDFMNRKENKKLAIVKTGEKTPDSRNLKTIRAEERLLYTSIALLSVNSLLSVLTLICCILIMNK